MENGDRKTFLNLNKKECAEIYPKILANGSVLLNTGERCAHEKQYGLALSLSILGAEEWIKGTILSLKSKNVQVFTIKELGSAVQNNHKNRHETASLFEFVRVFEGIYKASNLERQDKTKIKLIDNFVHFVRQANIVLKPLVDALENVEWWLKADYYKNRGLYVGFENELLQPLDITETEYATGRKRIIEIVAFLEMMNKELNALADDELKRLTDSLNKGLKAYNDSLRPSIARLNS